MKRISSSRHEARIAALQLLYEQELSNHPVESLIHRLKERNRLSNDKLIYASEIIENVIRNKDVLNESINKYAPAFPLKQMNSVDLNILRIAIFEILFDNKVPAKVAINEAIELAKAFSNENSARFINGVLGSLMAEIPNEGNAKQDKA